MGASEDLRGRPVELVDGGIGGRKSFVDGLILVKRVGGENKLLGCEQFLILAAEGFREKAQW